MAQVFEFKGKIYMDEDTEIPTMESVDGLGQEISDALLLVDGVDEVEIEEFKEVTTEKKEGK